MSRVANVRCPECAQWVEATAAEVPVHRWPTAEECPGSGRRFELGDNESAEYLTLALVARPAPRPVPDMLERWLPLDRNLSGWNRMTGEEHEAVLRILREALEQHPEVALRIAADKLGSTDAALLRLVAGRLDVPF